MNRYGRYGVRYPRAKRNDPCNVCGVRRLTHAAKNDFLNSRRIDSGTRDQLTDHGLAEVHGIDVSQRGPRLGKRRSYAVYDVNGFVHKTMSSDFRNSKYFRI